MSNYNHLSESEKILSVLDKLDAVSPETAVTTEQMVAKGIELGMTKDIFTENWHGHKEGDHPWWLLLAAMSGVGSEEEVAKYNVPHLHRQKVSAVKNGRKTKVMAYWYDESYEHEVTYTGKAYKEKMMRKKDIQMRQDPRYLEIGDKFYSVKFIVAHPEQFNPFWVERAMENIKEA